MAQRDYVARGQKKKKPANRRKQVKQVVPWFKVLLAILVVVAFVIGLFYLKESDVGATQVDEVEVPEQAVQTESNSVSTKAKSIDTSQAVSVDESELPQLEEEEWEFIEGLPSYSVEVEVGEMPESTNTYYLQCGSFKTQRQADRLKAQIALEGLEAQVDQSSNANGVWYRVRIGPYDMKRKADADRNRLRKKGGTSCQRWRNWN